MSGISEIKTNYEFSSSSAKKVFPCEGFDFKTCIRCPFWKHGKCQNGKDDKERNK